ncbi:MAG: VOC family protein, partial [Chloroflexota bacterium]
VTAGGFRIAWDTETLVKSFNPGWVEPVGQRVALAFKCASAAEVDALCQQVADNGYTLDKAPWDAFWGQRYAIVVDPDGSHIDLFAAL